MPALPGSTHVLWGLHSSLSLALFSTLAPPAPSPPQALPPSAPQVKGARYKTKRTLMEVIHRQKAEAKRLKGLADQATAAKSKAETKREKRETKKATEQKLAKE